MKECSLSTKRRQKRTEERQTLFSKWKERAVGFQSRTTLADPRDVLDTIEELLHGSESLARAHYQSMLTRMVKPDPFFTKMSSQVDTKLPPSNLSFPKERSVVVGRDVGNSSPPSPKSKSN